MPPRKSTSPAPTRATKEKATPTNGAAAKKSPAKKSPAPRTKSPAARGSKKAAEEPEVAASSSSPAVAKPTNGKASPAPASNGSAGLTSEDKTCIIVAVAIAVLLALVGAAAYWPLPTAAPPKVTVLSAKSFSGKVLNTGKYKGSALVAFTQNTTTDSSCDQCNEFKALTKSVDFRKQVMEWREASTLRFGMVYCNQQEELCSRFGLTGDDAPGLPYVTCAALHPRASASLLARHRAC